MDPNIDRQQAERPLRMMGFHGNEEYKKAVSGPESARAGALERIFQQGRTAHLQKRYAESLEHFRAGAALGCAKCMAALARQFVLGEGCDKDWIAALVLFEHAQVVGAPGDVSQEMQTLFQTMMWVRFRDVDPSKALSLFTELAGHGNARAQSALFGAILDKGVDAADDGRHVEAVGFFTLGAELGCGNCMIELAVCLANGTGCESDGAAALSWAEKALKSEDLRCHGSELSHMLYKIGKGVLETEPKGAVRLFREAAEHGRHVSHADDDACYELGLCYELGRGIEQSSEAAFKWYRNAAEWGRTPAAAFRVAECYARGTGVAQNYAEAAAWSHRAAEAANHLAQYDLLPRCRNGTGTDQDLADAITWLRRAADVGLPDAQYNLGCVYSEGTGVAQNDAEAAAWFQKAAVQGHTRAQSSIRAPQYLGKGTGRDETAGLAWYKVAAGAELGCVRAHIELQGSWS